MAIPSPPTITQTVPTTGDPVPSDTEVADLFSVGASTYAVTFGGDKFDVGGDQFNKIVTLSELDGAFHIEVTATNGEGTSEPASASLVFGDDDNPWNDTPDHYPDNPQLPPPLPDDNKDAAWQMFLTAATHAVVSGARDGVDFAVGRSNGKTSPPESLGWNTAVLGTRPDAAIEAEARRLAALWPSGATPITN